jgi:hypothetical protein
MAREVLNCNSLNDLMESDLNPEAKSILYEVRKGYQEFKIKERVAKSARRRRFLVTIAGIFSFFMSLLMILHFSGLLWLKGHSDLKFLLMR